MIQTTAVVVGAGHAGLAATAAGVAAGVMAGLGMAAFVVVAGARVLAGVVVGLMVGGGVMAGAGSAAGAAVGVAAGAGVGLGLSARKTAWPSYSLTVGWLAFSHQLPRSLMGFLADAHQRGVLRQAGAVYQFRHIELQHRLANRDAGKQ